MVKSLQECLHLKVVRAPRIKLIQTKFFCDPPHEFVLTLILAFEHLHGYELGITRLVMVDVLMESLTDGHTHVQSALSFCCITDLGTTGAAMIVYQMPSHLLECRDFASATLRIAWCEAHTTDPTHGSDVGEFHVHLILICTTLLFVAVASIIPVEIQKAHLVAPNNRQREVHVRLALPLVDIQLEAHFLVVEHDLHVLLCMLQELNLMDRQVLQLLLEPLLFIRT